jgi:hypothetical protein
MSAEYRVHIHYTEVMIRQAVLTLLRRRVFSKRRVIFLVLTLLAVVVLAYLQVANDDDSPLNDMIFGALVSSLVVSQAYVIVMWRGYYTSQLNKLRRMESPEVELTFTDENLTVKSSLSTITFSWKCFTEVWELQHFWMVFLSLHEYFTLPIDAWSPEVKEFVRSKLSRTAGKGWFL